jgi:DNA polymerase III delta prime subunit
MSDLWINKYKPKKLTEIVGHKYQKKKIIEWLKNIDNSKSRGLVISGNHGIGKTITIMLLLKELNYNPHVLYPNDIKTHRSADDFSDFYNQKNSIYNKLSTNKKNNSKFALVINKTESISLTSEKKYILEIFKDNNKNKSFPIIFVSNNQHSKLLNELKKSCVEIKFYSPPSFEVKSLIKKICEKENVLIKGTKTYNMLVEFSQFDIRRLINILQELSYHYKGKKIRSKNFKEFMTISREKNVDVSLFDATKIILNNYEKEDNILKLYEMEKVLLPLMIHENYTNKVLKDKKSSWEETIFKLMKISDSISRGDNIETSIYTDQNWYLQNIHGFYTCINTSYWINKNNNYDASQINLKFSSDLNKTSLKNINRKNINNLLKLLPNKSIDEILIMNYLCNNLVKNERYEEFVNLIKSYKKDLCIKDLELCLKIDKTNDFISLNTKIKKKLIKLINNVS